MSTWEQYGGIKFRGAYVPGPNLPPIEHIDPCYQGHLYNQGAMLLYDVHQRFAGTPNMEEIRKLDSKYYRHPAINTFGLLDFREGDADHISVSFMVSDIWERSTEGIIGPQPTGRDGSYEKLMSEYLALQDRHQKVLQILKG